MYKKQYSKKENILQLILSILQFQEIYLVHRC